MKIIDQILQLLHEYPETRDDDGELACKYVLHHFNGTPIDFIKSGLWKTIERDRRALQNEFTELQGTVRENRQKHAKIYAKKYRHQEKPESFFTKLSNLLF